MRARHLVMVLAAIAALPALAAAQDSSIAGVVKDSSGAMLPGVAVEASSPALIEGSKSAQTNGAGQYTILDLRPGTYTVTFTLPGFNTIKREGIVLTSDFTANVSVDMKVGAVEEVLTVTAEAPIVDVHNIRQRTVFTRELLDATPTGRNIQAVGILIPGVTVSIGGSGIVRDVGGSGNLQQSPLVYHGSTAIQQVDGMRLNNMCSVGQFSAMYWNDGAMQEISYITGADSAENSSAGLRINMIPKDGGNTFRGDMFINGTLGGWSSNNFSDDLRDFAYEGLGAGVGDVGHIRHLWDFNPSYGGPIKRDKLWFQATFRHQDIEKTIVGNFFDADPSPYRYTADMNRPALDEGSLVSLQGRITWQAASKHKFSVNFDRQEKHKDYYGISATTTPEGSQTQDMDNGYNSTSKWTASLSNKMFAEAGFAVYHQNIGYHFQPGLEPEAYAIFLQNSGKFLGPSLLGDNTSIQTLRMYMASLSYLSGSHQIKGGFSVSEGPSRSIRYYQNGVSATFLNPTTPSSITLRLPQDEGNAIYADLGLYVNDKWTFKRATVTGGLRFDWFNGEILDSEIPPGRDLPSGYKVTGFKNTPNWRDLSPRFGVAYDLFGNGKTALKASASRYVNQASGDAIDNYNPINTVTTTQVRGWHDDNGDLTMLNPDGSLQLSELNAPATNTTFGQAVPSSTIIDPKLQSGWFVRGYSWEYTAGIQHAILPRVSIDASWFKRDFYNQTETDDIARDASDYDGPFCVTAPVDPRLPGGGGYPVCGLYDQKPSSRLKLQQNYTTFSKNFGGESDSRQGFNVSMAARLSKTTINGGVNMERSYSNTCTRTDDSPEGQSTERFCEQTRPFRPDAKFIVIQQLPWDLQASGTYQWVRGPALAANWNIPNSVIVSALGRNLSACPVTGTCTVTKTNIALIEPNDTYSDSVNQLDFRLMKRIRMGSSRSLDLMADVYNVFNSSWIYNRNLTFGSSATTANPTWLQATDVLEARMFKLGAQLRF